MKKSVVVNQVNQKVVSENPEIIFNISKNAAIVRGFVMFTTFIFGILGPELFRSAYVQFTEGYTPDLFGSVPTSPIEPNMVYFLMPVGVLMTVVCAYYFLLMTFQGIVWQLEISEGELIQKWNGILKIERRFNLDSISKIKYKESSAFNSESGMRVYSTKAWFTYSTDKREKQVFLAREDKKLVVPAVRRLKKAVKALKK